MLAIQLAECQSALMRLREQLIGEFVCRSSAEVSLQVPELVAVSTDAASVLSPYNQALELVRQGVSMPDIAQRCGLSRPEIELLVVVYRRMG